MFLTVTNYPRKIYAWCPICFFPWKTIPVKFMLGVPYFSSPWKTIPPWNLCLVSYMFLPREKLSPWNLCLVSHLFFRRLNRPTLCRLRLWLTRDVYKRGTEIYCYCFVSAADARSVSDSCVFIARQYTNARKWYGKYVCLSARLSVRFLYSI